jgi:hypothetical protein
MSIHNEAKPEAQNDENLTAEELDEIVGGARGVPGGARGLKLSGGGVPSKETPYLAVELENVQITSYQLG